jgi:HK97 gp10 family phage protein
LSVTISVSVDSAGFTAAIQQLIEQYPEAVGVALMRVAEQMLQLSNVLVPVRTGFLKSTLGVRQNSNFSITFYATAPYAAYVEFGTRRMSARLFMTRALQQYQNAFAPEVAGALQQLQEAYFG